VKANANKNTQLMVLSLVAVAGLILGAWPMSYLASPRWDVWVVTADGRPISDANVALHYVNYSAEGESHLEILRTDQSGHVLFPEHYARASVLRKVFYTISSAQAGVHASFGRHASVFAYGSGGGDIGTPVNGQYLEDWRGNPKSMQSKIVAHFP
jgi:hypothetical protein